MKKRRDWLISAVSGYVLMELALIAMKNMGARLLGESAHAAFLSVTQPFRLVTLAALTIGVIFMMMIDKAEKEGRESHVHSLSVAFPVVVCVLQGIVILTALASPQQLLANPDRPESYALAVQGIRAVAGVALVSSIIATLIGVLAKKLSFLRSIILQTVICIASVGLALYFVTSLAMGMVSFMFIGLAQAFAVVLPAIKFVPPAPDSASGKPKSRLVAAILAFMLGATGAHRYYLGYIRSGLVQSCGGIAILVGYALYIVGMITEEIVPLLAAVVLLLMGSGVGIWSFVDFIRILTESLKPASGLPYSDSSQPAQMTMPTAEGYLKTLEKIAELHEKGILTDEEFAAKKAQVLEKL